MLLIYCNYNSLIYPPNDSYSAQAIFSKYVFPDHWEKTKSRFKEYFNNTILKNKGFQEAFQFENYVQQTDSFYNWIIEKTDWKAYDMIGFTLNYGQLLPSLAIAKKIKEVDPEKKIILGGSRTVGNLGTKVLETFDYVDFIVSGDGEEALYLLASDYENYESIPNLMYRVGKEIISNEPNSVIDLNSLPIPSFDPFYEELQLAFDDVKQCFSLYGKLPIEISRGCWWNKCTFCNLNLQHSKYREKNIDKIVEEIQFLSNKHKMLAFQMIGNTLPKKDFRTLFEKIRKLDRDFSFFVEARAGQLKSDDYALLKEAGFTTIQIGIETFSQNYLRKMNKGVRVIDNIASLKFCKEYGILNNYNLIYNYPNEERIDYDESKKNINFFKKFLDPPNKSHFVVEFGSAVYNNFEKFNVKKLEFTNIDKMMFPEDILKQGISFFYNFKKARDLGENDWDQLIEDWRKEHEQLAGEGIKTQDVLDKLIFFFIDGGNFIKIYDKRNGQNVVIYVLNEVEREIFLSCIDIIPFKELQEKFDHLPEYELVAILRSFEKNEIVFVEDNHYLSLPLCYSHIYKISPREESKEIIAEA